MEEENGVVFIGMLDVCCDSKLTGNNLQEAIDEGKDFEVEVTVVLGYLRSLKTMEMT